MTNAKIDVFLLASVLLLGTALILFPSCRHRQAEALRQCFNPAAFNATNAFAEIKALAVITPRHSGSPGAQKAAEHLLSRLRALGLQASLDEFEEETPAGKIIFRNVIGLLPGKDKAGHPAAAWIIAGAHYDTKSGIADDFEGANDSGSGVGVLLELARVIKTAQNNLRHDDCKQVGRGVPAEPSANLPARPQHFAQRFGRVAMQTGERLTRRVRPTSEDTCQRPDVNIMLVFFDGEECVNRYAENDGLHGSRRFAAQLVKDGRAASVRAVIILDMVGDRDLNITIPRNSALSLIAALFSTAEAERTRDKFALAAGEILDDHQPFLSAGMPAIDIIDFEYGSAPGRNDYWHTRHDTLDKLSVPSLEIIGRTVLRLLDDLTRIFHQ